MPCQAAAGKGLAISESKFVTAVPASRRRNKVRELPRARSSPMPTRRCPPATMSEPETPSCASRSVIRMYRTSPLRGRSEATRETRSDPSDAPSAVANTIPWDHLCGPFLSSGSGCGFNRSMHMLPFALRTRGRTHILFLEKRELSEGVFADRRRAWGRPHRKWNCLSPVRLVGAPIATQSSFSVSRPETNDTRGRYQIYFLYACWHEPCVDESQGLGGEVEQ